MRSRSYFIDWAASLLASITWGAVTVVVVFHAPPWFAVGLTVVLFTVHRVGDLIRAAR